MVCMVVFGCVEPIDEGADGHEKGGRIGIVRVLDLEFLGDLKLGYGWCDVQRVGMPACCKMCGSSSDI